MRNTSPTIVLSSGELHRLGVRTERTHAANGAEPYDHQAYTSAQISRDAAIREATEYRRGASALDRIRECLYDQTQNSEGLVAALVLTGHNVVVDGRFIPVYAHLYTISEVLDAVVKERQARPFANN